MIREMQQYPDGLGLGLPLFMSHEARPTRGGFTFVFYD